MEGLIFTLLWAAISLFMLVVIDIRVFTWKRRGWQRFIATFLLFYSQIIVSEFTLGLGSILSRWSLVIINFAFSAALLYAIGRTSKTKPWKKYWTSNRATLASWWTEIRQDPFLLVLGIMASAFAIWVLILGILFPAGDFDGNSYHLTFIGYVMQNHNFFDMQTSLKWLAGYPKGGEFIQMWSVIISGRDVFSDLAQLPFLGMGVYALYEISRRLGISKRHARFTALLFVFIPVVLNQLKTTYVDVMLCTLFFAALAIVLQKKLYKLDLLLVGICFSLIISIKSTGVLFVLATVPLLFWNLYQNKDPKQKLRQALWPQFVIPLLWMALPTIFGFYWYIKNWILYGSPIYPFGFKILGHHIFAGPTFQEFAANAVSNLQALPKGCTQRIWFVWTEQKDWFGCLYNYDTNYAGLGPIWFVVFIPAILTASWLAIRERHFKFLAVVATFIGLFAIYPTNYYSRYTLFITAIGVFTLAFVLDRLSKPYQIITRTLTIILALSVIGTNFVLCNYPPGAVKNQLLNLGDNLGRGPAFNNIPGSSFAYLENKLQPDDLVVYDSNPYFIYPLWKPDFSNDVSYIESSNKAEWLAELKAQGADYVFTTIWSKENKWARSDLKQLYRDEIYEIYSIK